MKRKGCLIVVSGASGTGKGTVCAQLLKKRPSLRYSISATTRKPRNGEQDGVQYYFHTRESFEKLIKDGGLLEWADVYGNYYGTPKAPVDKFLEEGQDILLEIDTQGALNVMEKMPEGIFVFLLPPSMEELERRLRTRGTDSEEVILRRLDAARGEVNAAKKYRYVVVNDVVENAVDTIDAILTAEHASVANNQELLAQIAEF